MGYSEKIWNDGDETKRWNQEGQEATTEKLQSSMN